MALNLGKAVVDYLTAHPDEKFSARQIAEWVFATFPDEEVLDEAFFRKYKNMSEPDKKKIRKILDAWEDE